ncbi:hypothetical protein AYI69_g6616 [Smittium culicis]|uniref:Peptidase A2 domain-containing protein n=1 Tax=Smittium culicis TaxID=133412 RepID=A0A1R1XXN8_9FUNG|nr:hypothetical protein AYI69_g6616 [Smittium culicis]
MILCRRVSTKNVNNVDLSEPNNTNCQGSVTILNKKYWAMLDTGAACSVMSDKLVDELGMDVDHDSEQVTLIAIGARHNNLSQ